MINFHLKHILLQREYERKYFIYGTYNNKKTTSNSKYFQTHSMNKRSICLEKPEIIVSVVEFLNLQENYIKAGKCFHCKKAN